jgi:SAM-dependent methyltransferase
VSGRRRVNDPDHVKDQYTDSTNLDARIALHRRFSTNDYGATRWAFDRLLAGPHEMVLDVGGGPGTIWASQRARLPGSTRVVVTDLSIGMAGEAARRIADPRFRYSTADAQALPFRDATFDVVMANHMLYHVPELPRAVAEFARVLRPNGRLLATTNGSNHMAQLRKLTNQDLFRVRGFDLEDGGSKLASHFDQIVCEHYPDALEVTEVEPIVDYIRSMSDFWIGARSEDEMRRDIEAVIENEGIFRIEKDAGIFTAVRR